MVAKGATGSTAENDSDWDAIDITCQWAAASETIARRLALRRRTWVAIGHLLRRSRHAVERSR
eukprot:5446922-Pyramimonas_sp.AAC.1